MSETTVQDAKLAQKLIAIAAFRLVEDGKEVTPETLGQFLAARLSELEQRPEDKIILKLICVYRRMLGTDLLRTA